MRPLQLRRVYPVLARAVFFNYIAVVHSTAISFRFAPLAPVLVRARGAGHYCGTALARVCAYGNPYAYPSAYATVKLARLPPHRARSCAWWWWLCRCFAGCNDSLCIRLWFDRQVTPFVNSDVRVGQAWPGRTRLGRVSSCRAVYSMHAWSREPRSRGAVTRLGRCTCLHACVHACGCASRVFRGRVACVSGQWQMAPVTRSQVRTGPQTVVISRIIQ